MPTSLRFVQRIRQLLRVRRVRQLARLMPITDAYFLASKEARSQEIQIRLHGTSRPITLRGATTDVHCFQKVFVDQEYRSPFDHAPRVIVDAGANVGMATVYYSAKYPNARIVAIEPAKENFDLLQRNCGDLPNVTLIQGALWPSNRQLTLSNPSKEAWAYSVREQSNSFNREQVRGITIRDILQIMGSDRIDLLKLDIEGSEFDLFDAGAQSWLGFVEYIVIELHDRFKPGCAKAFYSAIAHTDFVQEIRGENVFVALRRERGAAEREHRDGQMVCP